MEEMLVGEEPKAKTPVPQLDAYESWKMAGRDKDGALTSAATIFAPQGFKVELLRAATKAEDSWVGMTFDRREIFHALYPHQYSSHQLVACNRRNSGQKNS